MHAQQQGNQSAIRPEPGHSSKTQSFQLNGQDKAFEFMNSAREAHDRGNLKKALKFYGKVKQGHPRSPIIAEAIYQTARLEYERRFYRRAFKALTEIILDYPDFDKYNQVVRLQFKIATELFEGKTKGNLRNYTLSEKDYNRVVTMYETVVSNAPFNDYAPLALMKMAEMHTQMNNDLQALDALDRLVNNYPNCQILGDAYLLLANTFAGSVLGPEYDQGATRQAISHYEDFLILFPDHPQIKEGETGLAVMKSIEAKSKLVKGDFYYFRWKDLRAAKVFYNEAITLAPTSPEAKKAKEMIAQIDARLQIGEEQYPLPSDGLTARPTTAGFNSFIKNQ